MGCLHSFIFQIKVAEKALLFFQQSSKWYYGKHSIFFLIFFQQNKIKKYIYQDTLFTIVFAKVK